MKMPSDHKNIQQKVGENIESLRTKKKIPTKEMAQSLGLCYSAYRHIERGLSDISVTRLFRISEILEVHYTDLLEMNSTATSNHFESEFLKVKNHVEKTYQAMLKQYKSENEFLKKQIESLLKSKG